MKQTETRPKVREDWSAMTLYERFEQAAIVVLTGIIMIIIATVLQAASVNLPMFIVSRLVVGFGGMFVVQPSPMLIAELAYPTHRGKYTSAFWTMYYLGNNNISWCPLI